MDINIEARRSLKICKLQLIAWDSSCVGPITAECSASSLTVVSRRADSEERATFELRFPDGYVFQEGTLSPIRTDQGVRRRGGAALEPCREVTFGGVPFDRTDAVGREANREPVPGVPYSVDCAQCSAPILRRGAAFRRVLPLPSEGWREAAGDWFCHDHGDPKNGGIPDVLAPKEDELFTSADRFLVHHSAVQDGVVANDGRLRCAVCQRVVGKKDSCAASALFTTRVQVASDAQSRVPCSAGDAAFVVSSLIRGQLLINTNCRIILESEGDRSLLLWLMETGLEHCAASGLQPGTTCRVQPKPVIKLLYRETGSRTDAMLSGWKEDPLVAVRRLDEEVFTDVCSRLLSCRLEGASFEPFHVALVPSSGPE